MSVGLLNICKLYVVGLNTTGHLQIPVTQKQPFPLMLDLFKGFLMYIEQILCNKILSKNTSEININKAHNLVKRTVRTRGMSDR